MSRTEAQDEKGPALVLGQAPLPPIMGVNDGLGDGAATMRWTGALVWFMRVIALVWIAKGTYHWSLILDVHPHLPDFVRQPIERIAVSLFHWQVAADPTYPDPDFMSLTFTREATIVFFAVANLVAAIGLWLAAPWGGVLWLISAICEGALPLVSGQPSFANLIGLAVNALLVAVYFALSWQAAHERA
jgi:hypothetical protein